MNCYMVIYDLHVGADYEGLASAIKAYGTWAKITESSWAVVTQATAAQVRDNLMSYIGGGDRLFVLRSGGEAAWINALCRDEWLKNRL